MTTWIQACAVDEVEPEDIMPVVIDGHDYAVYRSPSGEIYATDGRCTHAAVLLADGLVTGHVIECPKHNGRFDYRTGAARGGPVLVGLRSYAVRVEQGTVYLGLD